MSLAHLRDGPLAERKNARAASLTKRAARLRALNQITQTITQNCGFPPPLTLDYDSIPSPPRTPSEVALLDAADLTQGFRFQDSLLPFSLDAIENNPAIKALSVRNTPAATGLGITDERNDAPASFTNSDPLPKPSDQLVTEAPPSAQTSHDAPVVDSPNHESQRHRPRTVHLPPQEVQEERYREKQLRQETRRRDAEAEKPPIEAASSPVSTAGAPSMTTPLPAGPSPLTSNDDDVASANQTVSKPSSLQPSPDEVAAKEQHDRLLQSQKEAAYREALGHDDDSPDVQLRLEQEQAAKATRDAANNAQSVGVPSTDAVNTAVSSRHTSRIAASLSHSASPSDSASDASQKKRAPRPSLVNIMPAPDPALANVVVKPLPAPGVTQSTLETNDSSRPSLSASKRVHTTGELPKIKTEQQIVRRQQRPSKDQPQSPASLRCSALLKNEGYNALKGASAELTKDYLEPLYRIQVHDPPNGRPLHELLQKASKVVTTTEQFAGYHERQDQRILRRIYQLQNANRWSLRQMEPCAEPAAPKTHMDHLLAEMKWMRTDFRQERKMKRATAKFLAEQCAEFVNADAETRASLQITLKSFEAVRQEPVVPHSPAESSLENTDRQSQEAKSPPELDNDVESSVGDSDMPKTPQYATVVPSTFFSAINMGKDTFHMQDNQVLHSALADLPLLTPFDEEETPAHSISKRLTPAVSKFCEAKMMIDVGGPPRKRSRYDYADEDDSFDEPSMPASKRPRASQDDSGLRPEQTDVALFEPENKLLRSRLHQNTAFRPPSEFQMPSSQFYEFRTASQWTEEDQQALRRLAKEYSFNWSLIADNLSLPSRFTSATDRRTPWECFERWVELESLPNEMRKTLYFKTWNQRLEGANRNNEAKYQAQLAQLAQTPGQPPAIMRKKTTPLKVDKRRQNRYLHMVDAMRKLARKREQQAHKQAEAQKAAHMRKQHENLAPKSDMPTPQQFSKMRQDRDVQIVARQERYREQVLASQRQAQMQRNGQAQNQQVHPNANALNRPGQNMPHGQASQVQPGGPQQMIHQGVPNGQHPNPAQGGAHPNNPQMGMRGGIPQAQMQPNMRPAASGQLHGTPDPMQQRALEMQRANQAKMNGAQYQMAPPNRASPGGMHAPNGVVHNQPALNGMQNPSVRTPGQQIHMHQSTPTGNNVASPHMPPPPTPGQPQQPQQLSNGTIPSIAQITHQLQTQHPQAPAEKIQEMANEQLRQYHFKGQQQSHQQARQSALSAAAGTHAANSVSNGSPAYNHNQAAFHQNNGNGNGQHAVFNNGSNPGGNTPNPTQQQYAAGMRQRLLAQSGQTHQQLQAQNNGSPRVPQANPVPSMAAPSPNMTPTHPQQVIPSNVNSRTPTPQMARVGSSQGSAPAAGTPQPALQQQQTPSAMQRQSPSMQQASPRPVSAGVARQ